MDKEKNRLESVGRLCEVVAQLRAPGGCPWDRVQTHESLKPACIEEAAEVLGGIDILRETGRAENLKEELGDLLLQVVFHAQLAQEEGLFSLADVAEAAVAKMARRHPHVFHEPMLDDTGKPLTGWKEIKAQEKKGREWEEDYLPHAFEEASALIEQAKKRKGI
ncbi:MazG nucleotide pyrophosphohydrolase domain-containing protein [Mitsuokella multacida]|uniref:MazG nucleotide pyrophosphohydrolase domain-containing protein n=1 Tax=Mitsuokella multacida TaxID=52226 RepID=UPI002671FA7D|nr:MazG nucleotide pyrophosphohydrolase domain-containing protein [Mitsuokella multacida]